MIRGLWTRETIGWVIVAALMPVAAVLLTTGGGDAALRLGAGLTAALFWQAVFRAGAGVPLSPSGALTALSLAVLGPEALAPWQIALAASFAMIAADLAFGGWGRNVIGAPATALAFVYLSYPTLAPPMPEAATALAAALSGLLLTVTGILSLRVALACAAALAAVLAATGAPPGGIAETLSASGAIVFALVFLIGDPVAAAATPRGRWIYGLLAGALAGLFASYGPGPAAPQPVIFAALLAQVFAPLIDHLAISDFLSFRARRNG